jgi:xanthine dehydrogenase accessory factor
MKEIYRALLEELDRGHPAVLVTVIGVKGSVPRHSGSKMLVRADGSIAGSIGGGKLEADAIDNAMELMGAESPVRKTFTLTEDYGALCGGQVELLFEPLGKADRLLIFGAGHIGQALAPLAARAGFQVTVLDDRPEYAREERFPDAQAVLSGEYGDLLSQIHFDERTYVVIVTHAHLHDEEILEFCLRQPFAYIGMIGSRRKSLALLQRLKEKGAPPDLLARVHTPIGLNIGAETPFEIAVSILAELIAARRGRIGQTLSMKLDERERKKAGI